MGDGILTPCIAKANGARGLAWRRRTTHPWEAIRVHLPPERPERLIADRGADRDPLRTRVARRGMEPILAVRRNHKRALQ